MPHVKMGIDTKEQRDTRNQTKQENLSSRHMHMEDENGGNDDYKKCVHERKQPLYLCLQNKRDSLKTLTCIRLQMRKIKILSKRKDHPPNNSQLHNPIYCVLRPIRNI
jgi:hypothetical protein